MPSQRPSCGASTLVRVVELMTWDEGSGWLPDPLQKKIKSDMLTRFTSWNVDEQYWCRIMAILLLVVFT